MKSIINKIIFSFCIVIFMSACHTFEHQNIFLENIKQNLKQQTPDTEIKNSKISEKKPINNSEMAPIDLPKQKERVQKLTLQKQVKIPKSNNLNLDKFKNWNEFKLIKKFGKSSFIKEEGKLKNYQYYFKECFLDVFLIKKENGYFVNYVETRPTKLNGKINKNDCLKDINQTLN